MSMCCGLSNGQRRHCEIGRSNNGICTRLVIKNKKNHNVKTKALT